MNFYKLVDPYLKKYTLLGISCVAFVVVEIFKTMTGVKTQGILDDKIIRALVIARGRDGATLRDIKSDYKEQIGMELAVGKGDNSLKDCLLKIPYIRTEWRNDQIKFFSEAPDQKHLALLISKQRGKNRKFLRSTKSKALVSPNYLSTPKNHETSRYTCLDSVLSNDDVFKRPLKPKTNFGRKSFLLEKSWRGSVTANHSKVTEFDNNNFNSTSNNFNSTSHNASKNLNNLTFFSMDKSKMFNETFATDYLLDDNYDPYKPEFFKCKLVGDHFFMNLAVYNLKYRMKRINNVLQSGLCVSGQTINDAANRIANLDPNQTILVNIGSSDIIKGMDLIELMLSMMRFFKICMENSIFPILTTLLPLENYRLGNHVRVLNEFNQFLLKNPFDVPVIDLQSEFFKKDGTLDPDCFQNAPRYVNGLRKPVVAWNTWGRYKVLKALKTNLGSALLKILLK